MCDPYRTGFTRSNTSSCHGPVSGRGTIPEKCPVGQMSHTHELKAKVLSTAQIMLRQCPYVFCCADPGRTMSLSLKSVHFISAQPSQHLLLRCVRSCTRREFHVLGCIGTCSSQVGVPTLAEDALVSSASIQIIHCFGGRGPSEVPRSGQRR